jgi:hypothetical protein
METEILSNLVSIVFLQNDTLSKQFSQNCDKPQLRTYLWTANYRNNNYFHRYNLNGNSNNHTFEELISL